MRDHPQITLAEAIELHLRAMRAKGCASRSLEAFQVECAHHLHDWLIRPLATLTRNEVASRHERLTVRSGPYLANRVLHQFRAAYNTAARRFASLSPTNPVIAVTFNRTRRRREPIPWPDLPAWHRRVEALSNPVRRDLQHFLLFTGLRSLDARTVRWDHVDFAAGTLHRPKPKGGEDRAFTIPLAHHVLELLARRRHCNFDDAGWTFPARTRNGRRTHVVEPGGPIEEVIRRRDGGIRASSAPASLAESTDSPAFSGTDLARVSPPCIRSTSSMDPKEQRLVEGRKVPYLPSPHRLRDTFATAAHEARVHPLDLKVLMNHTLPAADDVTLGYIRPSLDHLRRSTEDIASFLLAKLQARL